MLELMAVTELVVTDDSGDLRTRYFELRGLIEAALAKFDEIDPADVV